MKRTHAAATLAAIAIIVPPAHGQVGFGVGGGASIPTGQLDGAVHSGFHVRAVVDFELPLLPVGLRGDVMFQRLPGAGELPSFDQFAATVGGKYALLPLPLFSLHLTGGAGLYSSNYDETPGGPTNGVTTPGLFVGIGARISLLTIRPFVEARYHYLRTDPARSFVPLTIGLFF